LTTTRWRWLPLECFLYLAGTKTPSSSTSSVSAATIEKYLAANRPMVVNTPSDKQNLSADEKKLFDKYGLHPWRVYTV
jgi:hypothetical protein